MQFAVQNLAPSCSSSQQSSKSLIQYKLLQTSKIGSFQCLQSRSQCLFCVKSYLPIKICDSTVLQIYRIKIVIFFTTYPHLSVIYIGNFNTADEVSSYYLGIFVLQYSQLALPGNRDLNRKLSILCSVARLKQKQQTATAVLKSPM